MKYLYPTKNPFVTQKFGANPQVYAQFGLKGHNGTDYRAKFEPIYAAQDGTAQLFDTKKKGYGKHVKITHSDGSSTIYAHLSEFKVSSGQNVKIGQIIGISGNTGFSTAPHLHFGLRPTNYNANNGYSGYIDNAPYMTSSIPNPPTTMKLIDHKFTELFDGEEVEFNKTHDVTNAKYPGWTLESYNHGQNAYLQYKEVMGPDGTIRNWINYICNKPDFIKMRNDLQKASADLKKCQEELKKTQAALKQCQASGGGNVDKTAIRNHANEIIKLVS